MAKKKNYTLIKLKIEPAFACDMCPKIVGKLASLWVCNFSITYAVINSSDRYIDHVATIRSLQNHKKIYHKDIKEYACEEEGCLKKFRSDYNLRRHLRIHTGTI